MGDVIINIPFELAPTVYNEIANYVIPPYETFSYDNNFKHTFKFTMTADEERTFKKFLATRLGIYGDDLGKYTQRESADMKFSTNTPVTLTNIGTTFKNVYAGSDGLSIPIDVFNYNDVRIQVHWTKAGTGVQSLQIIQKQSPNTVLIPLSPLVSGPNNSAVLPIPDSLKNISQLYVIQVKSTVAGDSPTFLGIRILMR